jgi:alanine racemase
MATLDILKRTTTRPTWAEVSLDNLRHNFGVIRQRVGSEVEICAVVKADAYGHGATECARALEDEGAAWLGVTSLDEAIPLREAGIEARILLMTGFWRGEEEEIVELGLTPTVWEREQIESLQRAAERLGVRKHPIHLKVDTGMSRLGVRPEGLPEVIRALVAARNLEVEGVSTHLASSEVLDAPAVGKQLEIFESARQVLATNRIAPRLVHAANTNAIISRRDALHSMVRPGISLYGYHLPFHRAGMEVDGGSLRLPLKPVLTWKTRILAIRDVGPNQPIGYGGSYVTRDASRLAVLPVGYADGLNRALSSRGQVIVRGQFAPIVGRIAMDITLADVTGLPGASVGDEVILLGAADGLSMDAHRHATLSGTIVYETLCDISKRVPRRYQG